MLQCVCGSFWSNNKIVLWFKRRDESLFFFLSKWRKNVNPAATIRACIQKKKKKIYVYIYIYVIPRSLSSSSVWTPSAWQDVAQGGTGSLGRGGRKNTSVSQWTAYGQKFITAKDLAVDDLIKTYFPGLKEHWLLQINAVNDAVNFMKLWG